MNLEVARSFFMWCTMLNYSLLILWFMLYVFSYNCMKNIMVKVIGKVPYFDSLNIIGISFYKIVIIVFNLIPWIALTIIH